MVSEVTSVHAAGDEPLYHKSRSVSKVPQDFVTTEPTTNTIASTICPEQVCLDLLSPLEKSQCNLVVRVLVVGDQHCHSAMKLTGWRWASHSFRLTDLAELEGKNHVNHVELGKVGYKCHNLN